MNALERHVAPPAVNLTPLSPARRYPRVRGALLLAGLWLACFLVVVVLPAGLAYGIWTALP